MEAESEPSVRKHVEKQKSMIKQQRRSCAPPSAKDLAGRQSQVRFWPWASRLSLDGASSQWRLLFSRKGAHLWVDCFFPIALTLVFGYACSYAVFEMDYHYPKETWTFFSAAVAFLLTSKLSLAYARYWEGRGHLGTAVKCCRAIAILIKPRLGDDIVALDCADDARRYSMLYYWTMTFQLLGMKSKGMPVVMQHLEGRQEEEALLFERPANTALTALVWLSARMVDLAEAGVLSQHELQENCRIVNEMVDAFNGATKLKNTPIPLPMEHLCAVLTNLYVYTSPLALATAFRLATNSICHEEDPFTPGNWTTVDAGTPGARCMSIPMFSTFYGVMSRTCFSCFCLGIGYFGIFELGNTFAEPFGDDECDLGSLLMTMGDGLEADLNHIFEQPVPHSRLRRLSIIKKEALQGGAPGRRGRAALEALQGSDLSMALQLKGEEGGPSMGPSPVVELTLGATSGATEEPYNAAENQPPATRALGTLEA